VIELDDAKRARAVRTEANVVVVNALQECLSIISRMLQPEISQLVVEDGKKIATNGAEALVKRMEASLVALNAVVDDAQRIGITDSPSSSINVVGTASVLFRSLFLLRGQMQLLHLNIVGQLALVSFSLSLPGVIRRGILELLDHHGRSVHERSASWAWR
jgi:hypothetical protein